MLYKEEARKKIKETTNKIVDAVKETLGVFGNTVVIPTYLGNYIVTKDGVSVANAVKLEDEYENAVGDIIKSAILRTNKELGDGSSTTSVLIQAILNAGMRQIENGAHPNDLKKGIELAVEKVLKELDELATNVEDVETLKAIATISSNNDEELGELIGDLFEKIGVKGVTTIEASPNNTTYTDVIQGMSYDKGWFNTIFPNNKSRMVAEHEDVHILICDYKIETIQQIFPVLEYVVGQDNRPLHIICDDMDYAVMSNITRNMDATGLRVNITTAPYFSQKRYDFLEDIAIYTGATLFSKDNDKLLENFTPKLS